MKKQNITVKKGQEEKDSFSLTITFYFKKAQEPKYFDCYVEDYMAEEMDVKTRFTYSTVTDPTKWPWEFRIGLIRYICDDLDIDAIPYLHYYKKDGGLEGDRVRAIVPEKFLKSIL